MKQTFKALFIASILFTYNSAYAHHTDGFVTDSSGMIVTDGFGGCVTFGNVPYNDGPSSKCGVKPEPKKVAKPAPKPAPAPAPKPVVHEDVTLSAHALFDTDKSDLRPGVVAELNALVGKIKAFFSLDSITLTGHTDSRAPNAYNQALSERRAAAVKSHLVSKGIDGNKITTSADGEASPAASNNTAEGRQQNRRVDIRVKARK